MKNAISPEKLKIGNEQAFASFYKGYYSLFLAFALKYIPEQETARDIVQDVFIDYLKRRDSFQEMVQIKVFFYRSIRNKCLNLLDRQKTQNKYLAAKQIQEIGTNEYFLQTIIREETSFIIYEEIEKLSPISKKVIEMALDGKSNEEIADKLSISINTVKTHKARSYAILRKRLFKLRLLLLILTYS